MLTDEERVLRVVAAEGGRMHQRELVDRSGWTKARVSRLVAAMVDDGTLLKVQVGRENLLCLEGSLPEICRDVAPDSTASPVDKTDDRRIDDESTADGSADDGPGE